MNKAPAAWETIEKICDPTLGQCHDVPNLVLADGSIHCTSGITNPTLTILSLTIAQHEPSGGGSPEG